MKSLKFSSLVTVVVLILVSSQVDAISNRISSLEAETIRIINASAKRNEDAKIYENVTNILRDYYIESTMMVSKASDVLLKGLDALADSSIDNRDEAEQAFLSDVASSLNEFFLSGTVPLKSHGIALSLLNRTSMENFKIASELIQKGGFSTLGAINAAKYLLNQALKSTGSAFDALIETIRLDIECGFAAPYYNLQKSFEVAMEGLRKALDEPMQRQNSESCDEGQVDNNAADSLREIDDLANDALDRRADSSLVEELRNVLKCGIVDIVGVIAKGKKAVLDVKPLSENYPLDVRTVLIKKEVFGKNLIYQLASKIYNTLGYIASETNNESNPKVDEAIISLQQGTAQTFAGIENGGKIIAIGQVNGPQARYSGFEAALESGSFAEFVYIEAVIKCAQLAFALL